jgi:hypothetical protein
LTRPDDSTPEIFSDGVFFPSAIRRSPEEWAQLFAAERIDTMRRPRKPRQPTLTSAKEQASKAGIDVAHYEIKPDGSIIIVTGTSEAADPNPWLAGLEEAKR